MIPLAIGVASKRTGIFGACIVVEVKVVDYLSIGTLNGDAHRFLSRETAVENEGGIDVGAHVFALEHEVFAGVEVAFGAIPSRGVEVAVFKHLHIAQIDSVVATVVEFDEFVVAIEFVEHQSGVVDGHLAHFITIFCRSGGFAGFGGGL